MKDTDDKRVTVGDTWDNQKFEEITTVEALSKTTSSVHTIDGVEVEADVWAVKQREAQESEMRKTAGEE